MSEHPFPGPAWFWSDHEQTASATLVSLLPYYGLMPKYPTKYPIARLHGYPVCSMPMHSKVSQLRLFPAMTAFITKLHADTVLMQMLDNSPNRALGHYQLPTVIDRFMHLLRPIELPKIVRLKPGRFAMPVEFLGEEWRNENQLAGMAIHNQWADEWAAESPFRDIDWMNFVAPGY